MSLEVARLHHFLCLEKCGKILRDQKVCDGERQALESQTKTKQHPNDDDERPLLLLLLPLATTLLFDIN